MTEPTITEVPTDKVDGTISLSELADRLEAGVAQASAADIRSATNVAQLQQHTANVSRLAAELAAELRAIEQLATNGGAQ
jgi:hypothetical protein